MHIFSSLFLSLIITITLIPILKSFAYRLNAIDIPNERSMHETAMPKIGGIAIACGALVPVMMQMPRNSLINSVLAGACIIIFFGIFDDIWGLNYGTKFLGQLLAALVVIFYGDLKIANVGALMPVDFILPDLISIPLTLVAIVGVTNAVNLSDGLDGLAGGICFLVFICIAYMAYGAGNTQIFLLSVAVSGSLTGFLRFNTYPAVVFMGDVGSQFLGFLAITLSLGLSQGNTPVNALFPLILMGLPILDTLTVMTERIAEGSSPFAADKKHFHHRLIKLGFFHTEAVFTIYMLQGMLVTFAFTFRFYSEWLMLSFYLLFSGSILCLLTLAEKKDFQFIRPGIFDTAVKKRLKLFKDRNTPLKISFKILNYGFPFFLMALFIIPGQTSSFTSRIAVIVSVIIVTAWLFVPHLLETVLRTSVFIMIPQMLYMSHYRNISWLPEKAGLFFHLLFVAFILLAIITLKLTRRQNGFKASPVHFLIFFIAVIVPNLPDTRIQDLNMGLFAAEMTALLFIFNVIIGESRNELNWITATTVFTLLVSGAGVFF